MDVASRKKLMRDKRRFERDLCYAVENFYSAKKEEQIARNFTRESIQPLRRRGRYKDKQKEASNKVKEIAKHLRSLNIEYNVILARLADVPEHYWENSKSFEDEKGNIHVYLGMFDPKIGNAHHGHWIINKSGKLVYARLPFEPHGSQNHEDEIEVSDYWLRHNEKLSEEQRTEIFNILASRENPLSSSP